MFFHAFVPCSHNIFIHEVFGGKIFSLPFMSAFYSRFHAFGFIRKFRHRKIKNYIFWTDLNSNFHFRVSAANFGAPFILEYNLTYRFYLTFQSVTSFTNNSILSFSNSFHTKHDNRYLCSSLLTPSHHIFINNKQ